MASIADMLVNSALQTSQNAPDIGGSIQKGAALGEHIANVQNQRAALEQKKQDQNNEKWGLVGSMYDRWQKMPDGEAKKNIGTKVIPAMLDSFSLTQDMNPAVAEMMAKDPTIGVFLNSKVMDGTIKLPDMLTASKGSDTFIKFITDHGLAKFGSEQLIKSTLDENLPALQKSYEDRIKENESFKRTQLQANAAAGKAEAGRDATGQVKADQDFAPKVNEYAMEGGRATFEKNIASLESGLADLKSGRVKSGKAGGIAQLISDDALVLTNAPLAATRDKIRSAVQNSLRPILGGQFAAIEGEAIFKRAFNPLSSNAENVRRIEFEMRDLKKRLEARDAAVKYWEENGQSLKGFRGLQENKKIEAKAKNEAASTVEVNGRSLEVGALRSAYGAAKNKDRFIADMAKATGKSAAETKKLLEGK